MHIYISEELEEVTTATKTEESSTDHVPIVVELKEGKKIRKEDKIIHKRSMKEFTAEKWKTCLAEKKTGKN